jgi:putative ABC transport system permease protein
VTWRRWLVRRQRAGRDIGDEMQSHLAERVDDLVDAGVPEADARQQAKREFGNTARYAEDSREVWKMDVFRLVDTLRQDLLAVRALKRAPGFAAVAVLVLALGIGATTAMFSVIEGVLLRPLPFPAANRLVQIIQLLPSESGEPSRAGLTTEQVRALESTSRTLSVPGFFGPTSMNLTGTDVPAHLYGARVAPGLFGKLGRAPLRGRLLDERDGHPGSEEVVVLSHRTWVEHFGSDPNVTGRIVRLGDVPRRVIGIMPDGFQFPYLPSAFRNSDGQLDTAPQFWVPFVPSPNGSGGFTLYQTVALLGEHVTAAQAVGELTSLLPPLPRGNRVGLELVQVQDEMARDVRPVLMLLQVAAALLLVIACVNVANLVLTRAPERTRELATRLALGATRPRLARAILAETFALTAGGGLLGWLLAGGLIGLLRRLLADVVPRAADVRMSGLTLAVACLCAIGSGLVVGGFVARRLLGRRDVAALGSLAFGTRTMSRSRPSQSLVAAEVATALVLLVGAGLLLNSLVRLVRVDLGYNAAGVVTFRTSLPASRYATWAQQQRFYEVLEPLIRRVPGVEALAAACCGGITFGLAIDGQPATPPRIPYKIVTPGYFATMQIPIRRGRDFTTADITNVAASAAISEAFARHHFRSLDVLGRRIRFGDWPDLTIVSVVGDAKPARFAPAPGPQAYLPLQTSWGMPSRTWMVRARGDSNQLLTAIGKFVRDTDPDLPVYDASTLDQVLDDGIANSRAYAVTSITLGILALVLATSGLYGVLSYSVSSRTRELGIRMALGADASATIRTVIADGLRMTLVGIAAGLAAVLFLSRLLAKMVFDITPQDPSTLAVVSALFGVVAAVACYLPARRATRIDPVVALRSE